MPFFCCSTAQKKKCSIKLEVISKIFLREKLVFLVQASFCNLLRHFQYELRYRPRLNEKPIVFHS